MIALLTATCLLSATNEAASAFVLSGPSESIPSGPFGLDNADCQQDFYLINVSSTNTKFVNIDQSPQNQSYITSLIVEYSTSISNFTQKYTDGTFPFSGTFNISGTFCSPIIGAKPDSALQLLVHGIGFDSGYWDFSVITINLEYCVTANFGFLVCTGIFLREGSSQLWL